MPDLAAFAALLADRTRARILEELMGGVPLPAGALAARAGVAPSTVSGHLAKLEAAGLVASERHGRRREVRLAHGGVAEALEALGRLAGPDAPIGLRAVNRQTDLRRARSCYDHLAGTLGLSLADGLARRGLLDSRDGAFVVPEGVEAGYADLEVDLPALRTVRRRLVRECADWTERRSHVGGALGAALLESMLRRRWLTRRTDSRALQVTLAGERGLAAYLA